MTKACDRCSGSGADLLRTARWVNLPHAAGQPARVGQVQIAALLAPFNRPGAMSGAEKRWLPLRFNPVIREGVYQRLLAAGKRWNSVGTTPHPSPLPQGEREFLDTL